MARKPHLRVEDYVHATRHRRGAAELSHQAHEHLVEACPVCAEEWAPLGFLRDTYRDRLAELRSNPERSPRPVAHLDTDRDVLEQEEEATRQLRRDRRRVSEEKWELLRLPADERVRKIQGARSRFRSLLLAEMLIDECRDRVRNDPAEALSLVELVPHVLAWTQGRIGIPQAPVLLARAAAHRANALRVAGDLPAAEQAFIALRRTLAETPLQDPRAAAEGASLEASLCIDQRRFDDAEEYLGRAELAARHSGDGALRARIQIQRANLMQTQGRPAEIAPLLEAAAALLDPTADPHLFLCTVIGRVNALCDLGRPASAHRLLEAHLDLFENSDDPHSGTLYRGLEGRCALALGDTEIAEASFRASRDGHLALGRTYDAALAALYLAETLYLGGKNDELRQLSAGLASFFRSRGISGEALAALRLLGRATATDAVTAGLFSRLRRQLLSALRTRA